ncbi:CLUMA_CG011248, isoform A [Clunio marinus]|uniref:CLUMA_CG011248, isoform A n=1 Tax=Clunio marinus TaxID=568069 RepID=A0A1J1IHF1_9DIPT|nr:CLUMA_CG011248, isoform A [Clunio marinus]
MSNDIAETTALSPRYAQFQLYAQLNLVNDLLDWNARLDASHYKLFENVTKALESELQPFYGNVETLKGTYNDLIEVSSFSTTALDAFKESFDVFVFQSLDRFHMDLKEFFLIYLEMNEMGFTKPSIEFNQVVVRHFAMQVKLPPPPNSHTVATVDCLDNVLDNYKSWYETCPNEIIEETNNIITDLPTFFIWNFWLARHSLNMLSNKASTLNFQLWWCNIIKTDSCIIQVANELTNCNFQCFDEMASTTSKSIIDVMSEHYVAYTNMILDSTSKLRESDPSATLIESCI